MSRLDLTPAFARAALHVAAVGAGQIFGRIYRIRYRDALGYSKGRSRFSDPRRRVLGNRFDVVYLGSTLKVSFLEAVLRDQRNGVVGNYVIDEGELRSRRYARIEPVFSVELGGPARRRLCSDGHSERCSPQREPSACSTMVARLLSTSFPTRRHHLFVAIERKHQFGGLRPCNCEAPRGRQYGPD